MFIVQLVIFTFMLQDKQDSAALYSDEVDKSDSTLKEVNDEEINHYNKVGSNNNVRLLVFINS